MFGLPWPITADRRKVMILYERRCGSIGTIQQATRQIHGKFETALWRVPNTLLVRASSWHSDNSRRHFLMYCSFGLRAAKRPFASSASMGATDIPGIRRRSLFQSKRINYRRPVFLARPRRFLRLSLVFS